MTVTANAGPEIPFTGFEARTVTQEFYTKQSASDSVAPWGDKMASTGIDYILLTCHCTATRTLIQSA